MTKTEIEKALCNSLIDERVVRNLAAIAAMQAQITDHKAMGNIQTALDDRGVTDKNGSQKVVAERSVAFADALIEELK